MCGFAGAIGYLDEGIIAAVHRMNSAIVHRGPDDSGFWSSIEPGDSGIGAAFAHRRLSIIDLSDAGHQPMIDSKTGNVIAYNGEVYNFRQLRRELESHGEAFSSDCDTEVVLKAHAAWGDDCVSRFRGMFAFAIWDATRKSVILARDRLGIKPIYTATIVRPDGRSTVLFASELRAILESKLVDRAIDPVGLASYLWNGFVIGPHTLIRGMQLLAAGTTQTISAARPDQPPPPKRFWRIPPATAGSTTTDQLAETLAESVKLRLISDVPLGVFLSGGIDSSAVAALATRASEAPVRTFNISFEEGQFDESPYAAAVARSLGTEHTDVRLSRDRFRAQLEAALESLDQPTFDGVNTYFVSRAVRETGMTVALAGVGGDELFGGYRSFVDVPRAARWSRRLAPLPNALLHAAAGVVGRIRSGSFSGMPPQTRWGKLKDVLAAHGDLLATYQISYGLFTQDFLRTLPIGSGMPSLSFGLPPERSAELASMIRGNPPLHAISMLELACYTGERLLRDIDAASMAASLEVRVPLLDHLVVQTVAGLDQCQRFEPLGRKQALRDAALRNVEPGIFNRPKSGFVLPIDIWARAALARDIDQLFQDQSLVASIGLNHKAIGRLWTAFQAGVPGVYWSRIWSLFVVLWWCRRYNVRWDAAQPHGVSTVACVTGS